MARTQHIPAHRRSETLAMSDSADRLAQALRDLIHEAVQDVVRRERPAALPARVVKRPNVPEEDSELSPSCRSKNMHYLIPATEARQQLGGISRSTFYALVKEGEVSLVKIGSRSFVQPEALDDFVKRKATSSCDG